jgi:hypothetical protein
MDRVLRVAGRLAGLAAIALLGSFALDMSFAGDAWLQHLAGLLIHLLPAIVLAACLTLSWWWPRLGGVLFLIAALAPILLLSNPLWVNALLAALPGLAGLLLIAGGFLDRRSRDPQ